MTTTNKERYVKYYKMVDSNKAFKAAQRAFPIAKQAFFLGEPYFTDEIDTAAVTMDNKGHVTLMWNPDFFDDNIKPINTYYTQILPAVFFITLHEALHIILGHPHRCEERDFKTWNYACDIVINEMLNIAIRNSYGYYYKIDMPKSILRAEQFGLEINNVLTMSAEEVYDLIVEGGAGVGDSGGRIPSKVQGYGKNGYPDGKNITPEEAMAGTGTHDNWDDLVDEVGEDVVETLKETVFSKIKSKAWGNSPAGELLKYGKIVPLGFDWDQILLDYLAAVIGGPPKIQEKWAPPNRRLIGYYPQVLLPADHTIEKKIINILVAIDSSGSVSNYQLEKFIRLIAGIPEDRTQPTVISFDYDYYDLDWDSFKSNQVPTNVYGRGGTRFKAITEKIEEMDKYPDQVIVLTDGWAEYMKLTEEEKVRWVWVITANGSTKVPDRAGCKSIKINK